MPGRRWPVIVIDEARKAYERGVPVRQIAAGLYTHHQTIARWAKERHWQHYRFQLTETARQAMLARGKRNKERHREVHSRIGAAQGRAAPPG